MELLIISLHGVQLFSVAWVELITVGGSFIIQRNHAPMIIALRQNSTLAFVLKSGKHEVISIHKGIAEVTREKVTILVTE